MPSPDKIRAIHEAPTPSNPSELRAFLGLINYYHKFLSNILFPLYSLLQKDSPWKWSDEHTKQRHCKDITPIHICTSPSVKPLIVSADASPYILGVVLSHQAQDGSEQPISFVSRILHCRALIYCRQALPSILTRTLFTLIINRSSICLMPVNQFQSWHLPEYRDGH